MAVRQDPALRKVPVVLVTSSYVEPADRELARRAGANDLVPRTPELVRADRQPARDPGVDTEDALAARRRGARRPREASTTGACSASSSARSCSTPAWRSAARSLASELDGARRHRPRRCSRNRDVDAAIDEALAECFDAGGIAQRRAVPARRAWPAERAGDRRRVRARPARDAVRPRGAAPHADRAKAGPCTCRRPSCRPSAGRSSSSCAQADALLIVPLRSAGTPLGAS